MAEKSFRIQCQITSEGLGVPGLSVRIWNLGDVRCLAPIRDIYTNTEGTMAANLNLPARSLGDAGQAVLRLSVHDWHGETLWTSGPRRLAIAPGKDLRRSIKLEPDLVARHLKEVRLPDRTVGLLDRGRVAGLRRSLARLGGTPERELIARRAARYGISGICPGPDFEVIDALVRDAWRVLDGDPQAPLDFAEALDLAHFQAQSGLPPSGPGAKMEAGPLPARNSDPTVAWSKGDAGCSGWKMDAVVARKHRENLDSPEPNDRRLLDNGFINGDAALALLMAAREAGRVLGRSTGLASASTGVQHLVGNVRDIFCFFLDVEPVFRLAEESLRFGGTRRERFSDVMDLIGWECGPDDGPVPVPIWPRRRHCIFPDFPVLPCLPVRFYSFEIDEITPDQACAGTIITIRGSGFGDDTGKVCFRAAADSDFDLEGTVISWNDTTIVVRVPAGASCGLQVKPPAVTQRICHRIMTLTPLGTGGHLYLGGAAGVRSLTIDGDRGVEVCIRPNQNVTVAWDTCAVDRVDVEILDSNGVVVTAEMDAPPVGSFTWTVPASTVVLQYTARITVQGDCAPALTTQTSTIWVEEPAALEIQGLEITQAIQYYRSNQHLTDVNDQAADNAARLVVGKAAWVRVYVRSGLPVTFNGGQLGNVSGVLNVYRTVDGVETQVATLNPQPPGTVVAQANPVYATERSTIGATLNFVVPATEMTGRLRFEAAVGSPDQHCSTALVRLSRTEDVSLDQTLQVAAVMVSYNGPNAAGTGNLNLAAPGIGQVATALGWSLAVMPVNSAASLALVRSAGTTNLTVPLNDAQNCAGCCTPNWGTLGAAVAAVAANDGNQANWVYYGFIPGAVPMGPVIGCRSNGVASGPITNQVTTAHEITHDLGRPHAPCGNVGNFDAGYPAYEPYDAPNTPGATLGEFGLDIRNGTVHPPTDNDYMSYCGPRWISMRNHQMLQVAGGLVSTTISVGSAEGSIEITKQRENLVLVIGTVNEDDEVVLHAVRRVEMRRPVVGRALPDMQIAMLDAKNKKIAWSRMHLPADFKASNSCRCGSGNLIETPVDFVALLPDVPGAVLEFRRGRERRILREAPASKPSIGSATATIGRDGRLKLVWKHKSVGQDREVWVRYSMDRGKSWRGLATGLTGSRATLDISGLPPGTAWLELSLQDGFNVDRTTIRNLKVTGRRPLVAIVHPLENVSSGTLMLWGMARSCDGAEIDSEHCHWFLDGKEVATGTEAFLPAPRRGSHEVVFVVRDEYGESRAHQEFKIGAG